MNQWNAAMQWYSQVTRQRIHSNASWISIDNNKYRSRIVCEFCIWCFELYIYSVIKLDFVINNLYVNFANSNLYLVMKLNYLNFVNIVQF